MPLLWHLWGGVYWAVCEQSVLDVYVFEAGKMDKHKVLKAFDKGQIVINKQLA